MSSGNDMASRLTRGPRASDDRPRRWLVLAASAFVATALLVLSRIDHPLAQSLRWGVNDAMRPVLEAVAWPIGPLRALGDRLTALRNADAEIRRLKAEVADLRSAKAEANVLRKSVADLSGVALVVQEAKVPYVTARVLASSKGASAESIVIAAGREQGVRPGFPVVNGDGLVGRVVEVGRKVARVLLLGDPASRIPVQIGSAGRAILSGDGGLRPRLEYLDEGVIPAAGDVVTTSSAGGFLPGGLPVGRMVAGGGGAHVHLEADPRRLDYVSVLSFENPATSLVESRHESSRVANRRLPVPSDARGQGH